MLLLISDFLNKYFTTFRLFEYVTFRALSACIVSLIFSISIGNKVINWLKIIKVGQMVRNDGPSTHLAKTGTPTMGGVLIIITVLFTTLLFADLKNIYVWLVLFVLVSTGAIGFIDDFRKIYYKNPKGLPGKLKMLFQTIIAIVAFYVLTYVVKLPNNLEIVLPFSKLMINPLGLIGFFVLTYLSIVGTSNAVNLTDGLDGLVSMPIITVTLGLGVFAYIAGNKIFASHFLMPSVPGAHELVVICGAIIGATFGFLWFNAHPAKVFMGDVGALALGATLGVMAIIVRQEIAFVIMALLFVVEAVSVILQVGSYKLRKKRIFLMAPIHHHFELKGWAENQVVVRFWIISIMLLLVSLSTIKLR